MFSATASVIIAYYLYFCSNVPTFVRVRTQSLSVARIIYYPELSLPYCSLYSPSRWPCYAATYCWTHLLVLTAESLAIAVAAVIQQGRPEGVSAPFLPLQPPSCWRCPLSSVAPHPSKWKSTRSPPASQRLLESFAMFNSTIYERTFYTLTTSWVSINIRCMHRIPVFLSLRNFNSFENLITDVCLYF